mmetsp:Transcript_6354/g.18674  ORF Transcript_6354/g.18674 Transcript_6354/m.18674 type:complete len:213 (-) Transcript_6354:602-1240(-)
MVQILSQYQGSDQTDVSGSDGNSLRGGDFVVVGRDGHRIRESFVGFPSATQQDEVKDRVHDGSAQGQRAAHSQPGNMGPFGQRASDATAIHRADGHEVEEVDHESKVRHGEQQLRLGRVRSNGHSSGADGTQNRSSECNQGILPGIPRTASHDDRRTDERHEQHGIEWDPALQHHGRMANLMHQRKADHPNCVGESEEHGVRSDRQHHGSQR